MLLIKYLQALDSMYFTKFIKQMSEHAGFLNALFNVKPCRSEAVFLLFMFFGTFPPLFLYIKDVFLQFQTSLKSCVVWVRLEWMRGARLFVILSLYCWTWQQNINFLFLFFVHFRLIAVNTSRTGCSALTLKLLYNSLYTQYGIASVLHKSHCRYTVNHTLSVVHEKCSCEVIENSQRLKSSSKCKRAVTFGLKQTCTEQKIDTTLWYLYSPVPSVSKSGPIMFFLIICLIL